MKTETVLLDLNLNDISLKFKNDDTVVYVVNENRDIFINKKIYDDGVVIKLFVQSKNKLVTLYSIKKDTCELPRIGAYTDDTDFIVEWDISEEDYFQISLIEDTLGITYDGITKFKNIISKLLTEI